MNDFAKLELELMTRARGALDPSPTDRARLREQLTAKIALLSTAAAVSFAPTANTQTWRHLLNSHLARLTTVAATAGVLAFGAGYFTGLRARPPMTKTVTLSAVTSIPEVPSIAPPASAQLRLDPASLASASEWGHSGTRTRVAAKTTASTSIPENPLVEELDVLRRAERMIRQGNSLVALGFLRDLDERYPKGQLLEERSAARVMANCQLADAESARSQGQAYLSAHARSVYADRVRSICQLDSAKSMKDSPASGD
jgi:hypothetical protein